MKKIMLLSRFMQRQGPGDPKPDTGSKWTREWFYFVAIMVAWCFTPLIRRLVDWHNGFYNPIQITSLIPFLLTLPLAFICFRPERLARLTPAFKLFAWVWFGTLTYGVVVALFLGNIFASFYEAAQYAVPMLIGIWLAGLDTDYRTVMKRVTIVTLTLGGIIAIYGIAQWVSPAPWDVLWITGGGFEAMGVPVPFGLRIFSTLPSAGPASEFFALAIIIALPVCMVRRIWIWPLVAAMGAALLLTLVREAWIALVFGALVYLIASPRRFRAVPFIALYAVLIVFLVSSLPALLGAGSGSDVVTARIATLGDVDHDDSALQRAIEIQTALEQSLSNPFGTGLGMIGAASALSSNPDSVHGNVLDSGYMARLLELGWLGFGTYLFVVVGGFLYLLFLLFDKAGEIGKSIDAKVIVATAAAICAALIWADAAGDTHLGLDGMFFWIAMGLGLRQFIPAGSPVAEVAPRDRTAAARSLKVLGAK